MFRSRNRILGGVCGGLANYLNIDPIIVRVAWGIASFVYGVGILAYVIIWIVAPEE